MPLTSRYPGRGTGLSSGGRVGSGFIGMNPEQLEKQRQIGQGLVERGQLSPEALTGMLDRYKRYGSMAVTRRQPTPGRAPISTLQSPSPRGPVSRPVGGLQQKRKFLGMGEKLPSATQRGSPQPLKGKRAPTKRTGGMGSRPGIGQKEGPFYGGKPMFSAAARAKLRPGQSLSSQMRQLQGGRTGGARRILGRGRL